MDYPVTGLHHITGCSGGAQEDVDFFAQVVGQRLIKQTILFGGRYAHYHLSYANGKAEPGTVMTTFPYQRVKGRSSILVECGATWNAPRRPQAGSRATRLSINWARTCSYPLVRGSARRDFGDAGSNSDSGIARARCRAADHSVSSNGSDVLAC
jgi:catechol 2,3-dioxygenase-like lactoylglutathione lyase family enzyme